MHYATKRKAGVLSIFTIFRSSDSEKQRANKGVINSKHRFSTDAAKVQQKGARKYESAMGILLSFYSIINHSETFNFCNVSSVLGPTVTFSAPGPLTCPSGLATTPAFRAAAAAARSAGSPLSFTFLIFGSTFGGG